MWTFCASIRLSATGVAGKETSTAAELVAKELLKVLDKDGAFAVSECLLIHQVLGLQSPKDTLLLILFCI